MHTRPGRAGTWALVRVPTPEAIVGYDAEVVLVDDGSASVHLTTNPANVRHHVVPEVGLLLRVNRSHHITRGAPHPP
jgi:hypothetical protein